MPIGQKGGPGRGKKTAITLEEVEKLASFQCTDEEMASWFGIARETFVRKKTPEIIEAIKRGQAKGRVSLRRAQFAKALSGHPTMLVWMGKQILGQRDTLDHTHTGEMSVTDGARDKLISKLASLAAAKRTDEDTGVVQ